MCTLVILRRPDHAWPLLVAGNRDEMPDRPWSPPARHWPDRPEVLAGLDHTGDGSWFGINDHGLVAAVTNRVGSLGPQPGRRSRGELVLEALDHAEAGEAAAALVELDPRAYRGFNLFIGDPNAAYWLRHVDDGRGSIQQHALAPGLHMLTAGDLNDRSVPRIRLWLPRFAAAAAPDPDAGQWQGWEALLGSQPLAGDEEGAISAPTFRLSNGFGTLCSQLAAVPRHPGYGGARPVLRFAAGPPDHTPFEPVPL